MCFMMATVSQEGYRKRLRYRWRPCTVGSVRYHPPGMCLNDFSLLDCADGWRVLHLQGPPVHPFDAATLETSFGLARSELGDPGAGLRRRRGGVLR